MKPDRITPEGWPPSPARIAETALLWARRDLAARYTASCQHESARGVMEGSFDSTDIIRNCVRGYIAGVSDAHAAIDANQLDRLHEMALNISAIDRDTASEHDEALLEEAQDLAAAYFADRDPGRSEAEVSPNG